MDSNGLTFEWSPRRWFCPRLATTLGLSIFVHLLIALLFVIVKPEKVTSPSPAPEISLLSEQNPEHRALLDSLKSESPIGALAHQLLPVGHLADASYQYSFSQSQLVPLPPPRWTPPKASPLIRIPNNPSSLQTSSQPTPVPLSFPGSVSVSSSLTSRILPFPPIPTAPTRQLLEPVTFLVGIRDQGTVAFSMLQKSSGNGIADTEAEAFIHRFSFQKNESPLEWGFVTLLWASPVSQ